jgi:hypothetical protein
VIKALIGHMKTDGLMDRNWLKGQLGDAMHVALCAAGQNLRLILKAFVMRWILALLARQLTAIRHRKVLGALRQSIQSKIAIILLPRADGYRKNLQFAPT